MVQKYNELSCNFQKDICKDLRVHGNILLLSEKQVGGMDRGRHCRLLSSNVFLYCRGQKAKKSLSEMPYSVSSGC